MQRNIDTGGARALVESTGAGKRGTREGKERGRDNEYEYCIEANVVVYTSRCEHTGKNIFARCIFSPRHARRPAHIRVHAHVGPSCVENGHGRREFT